MLSQKYVLPLWYFYSSACKLLSDSFILNFILPDLINKHKSVHGNTPFAGDEQRHPEASTLTRGRGHSTSVRGSLYAPQIPGSWRKTYSLRNKSSQSSAGHPSASTSSGAQFGSQQFSHGISLPSHSRSEKSGHDQTATSSSELTQRRQKGQIGSLMETREGALKKTPTYAQSNRGEGSAASQHEGGKGSSNPVGRRQHEQWDQTVESGHYDLTGSKISGVSEAPSSVNVKASISLSSSQLQIKPSFNRKVTTESNQITTQAILMTAKSAAHPGVSTVSKQPPLNLSPQRRSTQVGETFIKKSKFTWVKSQNTGGVEPRQGSSVSSLTGKTVTSSSTSLSKPGVTGTSPLCNISKRTPARKLPRKLSPVTLVPKTSKYRWVSSSAVTQTKTPRKTVSPKGLTPAHRGLGKNEATVKLRLSATPSAKVKKGTSPLLGSRYRWKAGGQCTSVPVTGVAVARRRSAFHWTSEKSNRGVKGGLVLSPLLPQRASVPLSSPGGFKLRSRMKIIRRSASR